MKKKESNVVKGNIAETYCEKCDEEMIFEDGKCTECGSPAPEVSAEKVSAGPYQALLVAARNMCEQKNSAALEELKQAVNAIDQEGGQT